MSSISFYNTLIKQAEALVDGETNRIANMANISALLFQEMEQINWAGFYLLDSAKNELVLGPFQGAPACVRIPIGKGVCGSAAENNRTLVVGDVHQFPGHIACDARSNSEIVLPFSKEGLLGVLDIDSPELERFDGDDAQGLSLIVRLLESIW